MKIHVAAELPLPIDAATQTFAFIARKGGGKTYAAGKLAEELLSAEVQVIVLDTVGNWYGLRIGADGRSEGFDIPLFGGLRGDIPLESTGGALIADIAVESGRSMVLDASQFSLSDRKRFAVSFGEELWRRKKGESHPSPLHLIIEESQLIVPQSVQGDAARMVGIYEEIIRLGRNYGIGVSMITQRPQSVNKEVLNQTECLFVGQINGSQERDALKKWITHQGMDPHLVDELPSLAVGTFYVWSPQWLRVLEKVTILPKATFDASATPRVGQAQTRREPKPIDLDDLKSKMAATIERAKENDPKELKKQNADLRRQLSAASSAPDPNSIQRIKSDAERTARAEVAEESRKRDQASRLVTARLDRIAKLFARIGEPLVAIATELGAPLPDLPKIATTARAAAVAPPRQIAASRAAPITSNGDVPRSQQKILDTLAMLESVGITQPSKTQLAVWADVSPTSGGYFNNLGALRSGGFIDYPQPSAVALTAHGRGHANLSAPPSAEEMQQSLCAKVGSSKAAILRELIRIYPRAIEKTALAERLDVSPTSGGYFNNLGSLRTLGVIDYPSPGHVAAQPLLFLE